MKAEGVILNFLDLDTYTIKVLFFNAEKAVQDNALVLLKQV